MLKPTEETFTSHSIKTPLTNILINLHLALQKNKTNKQKQFLNSALISANNISEILKSNLNFFNNSKETIFSLNSILKEIKKTKKNPHQHNLDLEVKRRDDIHLYGNKINLKIALDCLISNAMESYPNYLSDRLIKISTKKNSNFFIIYIIDNGIGLSFFKKMLVSFKGISFKKHGNGCGIWLAKKILKSQFGAYIQFKKNIDLGTTTIIKFKVF
jgi:light-regulated signal transduction histidine kinase (bacteriophytochrome)